jgi:hypothetical protein
MYSILFRLSLSSRVVLSCFVKQRNTAICLPNPRQPKLRLQISRSQIHTLPPVCAGAMSRPSTPANNALDADADANADDQPPRSPASPLSTAPKPSTVKEIAEKWGRTQLRLPDAEPAKPKHDLKKEYKDPWKRQRREEKLRERVRKADGEGRLEPHLREPWERAREQAGASQRDGSSGGDDVDGRRSEGEDEDPWTQIQLPELLQAQLPQQASLHLLRAGSAVLPAYTTPFAHALEPWLQENPEYRHYLEPTTPSSSTPSSLPAQGSSMNSGEVSARTDEAFPEIPFESIAVYLRDRNEPEVRIKILHVRTLLLRCAVLVRGAWVLEQAEWKASAQRRGRGDNEAGRMGQEWYKAYSKAGRAAEKGEQMAKALGVDGLQARSWYWKGRADAGRRYWDEAAAAFRRAEQFDRENRGAVAMEEYGKMGLTPFERRDVEWLRKECQMKDELAQRRRQQRTWAEGGNGVEELEELEDLEEPVDLGMLYAKGDGENETGKAIDIPEEQREIMDGVMSVLKEKYKTRYIKPFSKEELDFIMQPVPIAERKQRMDLKSQGFQDDNEDGDGDREGGWFGPSPSAGMMASSDHAISIEG